MSRKTISENQRAQLSLRMGDVLLYGTFGLLMFGPVAFGAVEPWSIFVLETGAVVLALTWVAKQWIDEQITVEWNPLFLPMAAFGVLILSQIVLRRSAYLHDTLAQAVLYGAYAMLCFVSSQALLRSSEARRIAVILSVFGFAIAALGLLQGIAPNGKLYWLREPRLSGWIYGPYVNHNHYAGLMEMLIPIPLVISLSRLAHQNERVTAGVAAAVMTGTVFLSGSRGGMLALLVEFAVLAVIVVRQKRGPRMAAAAGTFAVVLLILLVWLGGKQLTNRVFSISTETRTEISGGTRLKIDHDAITMFRQKPVLGWGLGCFPVVYPQFRSFYTNFFVNEAHNDYLQMLAETGSVGFAIAVWFVIVLYRGAFRKIRDWMSSVSGALSLACMLGCTGILVHSFFDFNLQIPANAAIFYVLSTLAAGPALLQRRTRRQKPVKPAESEEFLPASEVV